MSRIFISYRRQDTEGYVGRLYDHLAQYFERGDVFMDVDNIRPGADFVEVLEEAVNGCDALLAIIGPQWLTALDQSGSRRLDLENDFVRIEIASALKQKKLVIPVLVGGARMPTTAELPSDLASLARRNAVELSHQRFAYDVERLARAMQESAATSVPVRRVDPEVMSKKEEALKLVRADLVNATTSPLYQFRIDSRSFPVLGEGNPDARIMFIGEAPGKNEVETGRPFCGPSGEVLEEMLKSINLKRQDVYLTNVLLDRAPEKRDPLPEEIDFYTPFVDRLIDIIQPSVLATLGRFAMQYVLKKLDLPEKRSQISQIHGTLIKTQMPYGEIYVAPLYHPAVVLYSASQKETLRKDFQRLRPFV